MSLSRARKSSSTGILKPARWREYLAILIVACALMLATALLSYDRVDIDAYHRTGIGNAVGIVGAYCSWGLFVAFGVSAYLVPLLMLALGVMTFMRVAFPSVKVLALRALAVVGLMLTAACACHLVHPDALRHLNIDSAGGVVGIIVGQDVLVRFCGTAGSVIILAGVALILVLFMFDTSLRSAWRLGRYGVQGLNAVGRVLVLGCAWIGAQVVAALNWSWRRLVALWARYRAARAARRARKPNIIIVGEQDKETRRTRRARPPKPAPEPEPSPEPEIEVVAGNDDDAEEEENVETDEQGKTETADEEEELPPYVKPDPSLLDDPEPQDVSELESTVITATTKLSETLAQFGIDAQVGDAICGPVITCYEVHPAPGVKVSRITALENDLALAMKAKSIRIVAPIPGRDAVGIELPNAKRRLVTYSQLAHSREYAQAEDRMELPLALGQTLTGETFIDDLTDMPHLLVAGATGSGKSVCINTILLSILLRFEPDDLKLVLVDPKHVELVPYHNLPHLLVPVLNDPSKVADALEYLIGEMERRYKYFARLGVRNISMYNSKQRKEPRELKVQIGAQELDLPMFLPYIVVVIDELADLMLVAADEIERKIIRLAQLARAAGIHMVVATQRPSTNVITGLIKANIPARIAFRTTSNVDSRVIIDEPGSEKLLGKGDMLYKSPTVSRTMRIQGAFVSEEEVRHITEYIREQREPHYVDFGALRVEHGELAMEMDDKFDDAIIAVLESGQASASYLQRRLQVGYARAARLIDLMEAAGIVGPKRGAKPRDILVEQWPPEVVDAGEDS
jgi:S-DNA-T family DNA segregation ATPase FtsK/SpoIIIE